MSDFKADYKRSVSNESNIIKGEKYRFTILSPRLIRLEYSESGNFVDKPTEFARFRDFSEFKFEKQENDKFLLIRTKYFQVTYLKNKPILGTKVNPTANLKIELLKTDNVWYYKHPEAKNYGAPSNSIDDSGKINLKRGLYSLDGFSSYDDSKGLILDEIINLLKEANQKLMYMYSYTIMIF